MKINSESIKHLIVNIQAGKVSTPSYVLDESVLIENLEILQRVERQSGCRILLAQKAFSVYQTYPLIEKYISGVTASGLFEAKLGHEKMKGENHVFSPVYKKEEFGEILNICDHIIFNSFREWDRHREQALEAQRVAGRNKKNGPEFGIRLNPCCSTQKHAIYDPCAYGSRFGVRKEEFRFDSFDGISGIHFHTLCEQNSGDLKKTIEAVERDFSPVLHQVKWVNLGGGHHITREDYDIETLIACIRHLQENYDVQVYLEPGEAVVLNAGYMVSRVLDIGENGIKTAILDASAACHMPDIIEMPYTPKGMAVRDGRIIKNTAVYGISQEGTTDYTISEPGVPVSGIEGMDGKNSPKQNPEVYRFGGNTCLAGDVFGDYKFERKLQEGDHIVLFDMALYSMVKNNTFNGIGLPSILYMDREGNIETIKRFGYEDFESRL